MATIKCFEELEYPLCADNNADSMSMAIIIDKLQILSSLKRKAINTSNP